MVEYNIPLDDVFHALADPTRRAMLEKLKQDTCSISDLAEPFAMSLAGASKHIKVLEAAKLVSREKRGRTHFCQLNAAVMAEAFDWLETYSTFWNQRLDVLEHLLREEEKGSSDD